MSVKLHKHPRLECSAALIALLFASPLHAHNGNADVDGRPKPLPSLEAKTEGLSRHRGLLTTYLDHDRAKLYLELPPPTGPRREIARFIYVEGLLTGLGSNPVGLDRGQLGDSRMVLLRKIGRRLLVEQPNLSFRALSDHPAERQAVDESFATSVIWAGDIVAQDSDGRSLVDFTSFVVRDAHHVARRLRQTDQGDYKLDAERSVLEPDGCLAFPDNLEFEALLTFTSAGDPGGHVRATAPSADSITLTQHHSLIRLPEEGYKPRRFDLRAPSFAVEFLDYAAPLDSSMTTRWIVRHRLEKTDPTATKSKVKEPIVYYVDPAAPEPVRSALIEGASWWAKAFEAAGFIDAFRVQPLPDDVHPLDARYNVIQWVHRSTRGWSYGNALADPRTGEIIKGHVSLGSLRVRQDRLLFEALAGTEHTGSGRPDDPVQLALARIRQLSAHEVGHTLGFTHNFAASTYGGRASVMDYPAPLVRVTEDDQLDFSDAYGVGVGAWDVFGVRYAYTQFTPDADEDAALDGMIREALDAGMLFIADHDARPAGAAHPLANLWDNGSDPVAELQRTLDVRRIALARFGERNVRPATPLSLLHEVLVPLYLYHRYQVDAAAKVLGGMHYTYALRGDGQPPARPVAAARQTQGLETLLQCLSPEELDLPESVISLLLPRPYGHGHNRELFESSTGVTFDALGAAATAADLVLSNVLQPQRCARIVDQHRRNAQLPSLEVVLDRTIASVFPQHDEGGASRRQAEIQRVVQHACVARMIQLASSDAAPPAVTARLEDALRRLRARLTRMAVLHRADSPDSDNRPDLSQSTRAHARYLIAAIDRFLNRPHREANPPAAPPDAPPGSPIGITIPDLGRCSFAAP